MATAPLQNGLYRMNGRFIHKNEVQSQTTNDTGPRTKRRKLNMKVKQVFSYDNNHNNHNNHINVSNDNNDHNNDDMLNVLGISLWHRRLCHVNRSKVRKTLRKYRMPIGTKKRSYVQHVTAQKQNEQILLIIIKCKLKIKIKLKKKKIK